MPEPGRRGAVHPRRRCLRRGRLGDGLHAAGPRGGRRGARADVRLPAVAAPGGARARAGGRAGDRGADRHPHHHLGAAASAHVQRRGLGVPAVRRPRAGARVHGVQADGRPPRDPARRGPALGVARRGPWSRRRRRRSAKGAVTGYLIAFEGGDGAGKSTQAALLAAVAARRPGSRRRPDPRAGRHRRSASGCASCCSAATRSWTRAPRRCCSPPTVPTTSPRWSGRRWSGARSWSPTATSTPPSPTRARGRDLDADESPRCPGGRPTPWRPTSRCCSTSPGVLPGPPRERRRRGRRTTGSRRCRRTSTSGSAPGSSSWPARTRTLPRARRHAAPGRVQERIRRRVRDVLPLSARQREPSSPTSSRRRRTLRSRRAEAEAEVLRLDAELRGRQRDESRAREQTRRRLREEAERELDARGATPPGASADDAAAGRDAGWDPRPRSRDDPSRREPLSDPGETLRP